MILTFHLIGLALCNREMFVEAHGDRPDAPNIIIIIFEGDDSTNFDKVDQAVDQLSQNVDLILLVGVGDQVGLTLKSVKLPRTPFHYSPLNEPVTDM